MVHTVKNFPTSDATSFHVFGRVFNGTLYAGQQARVLGESYTIQVRYNLLCSYNDVHYYRTRRTRVP